MLSTLEIVFGRFATDSLRAGSYRGARIRFRYGGPSAARRQASSTAGKVHARRFARDDSLLCQVVGFFGADAVAPVAPEEPEKACQED